MTSRQDYHWPQLFYNKKPYQQLIKACEHSIDPLPLPFEMVQYLLIVSDQLKITMSTVQLTLSVASRFLRSKSNLFPLQLVIMTSLMICCKFMETNPPDISTLHKYSNNSFTNRGENRLIVDFYRTEMLILNEINFDITAEGIPSKQIQLVIRCVKTLLREEEEKIFPSIISDLEQLFWTYLYTGKIRLREKERNAIAATLIHLSLVFLTQYSGRFLQTLWACELTGAEEKEVTLLGNRFLKEIVGEDKSKNYKI